MPLFNMNETTRNLIGFLAALPMAVVMVFGTVGLLG